MLLLLEYLRVQRGRLIFLSHAAKNFDHQTPTFPFIGSSHGRWVPQKFKGLSISNSISHGTEDNSIFLINRTMSITVKHSEFTVQKII